MILERKYSQNDHICFSDESHFVNDSKTPANMFHCVKNFFMASTRVNIVLLYKF